MVEKRSVSAVVPVYNEAPILDAAHARIDECLSQLGRPYEIIYINDGSSDDSLMRLDALAEQDKNVSVINLSRNYGKEIALSAGLDKAAGDLVVVLDADLQDPPELISDMLDLMKEKSVDVVYGVRKRRDGESFIKKITAKIFYKIVNALGEIHLPENSGDFRLMSRRVVTAICAQREKHRYMKGIASWVGFPSAPFPYDRDSRIGGETGWGYWKLINLAIEGITSTSMAPLRFISLLGIIISISAFIFGGVIMVETILYGNDVAGYPSLMVAILFLGGIQLFSMGIIGEYLGRVFNESKNRSLYFTESVTMSALQRKDASDGLKGS